MRPHSLILPASLLLAACEADTGRATFRDLYERQALLDDAQAGGLFAACPLGDAGPWVVRHLDAPNEDAAEVRVEFAKVAPLAWATCVRGYLQDHGAAEFEGDTEQAQYGTWYWGSTTENDPNDPSTTGTATDAGDTTTS